MKNLIKYYYNITCLEIRKTNNYYAFVSNNIQYCFLPYEKNINELYKNYFLIINMNMYCHEVIINSYNSWITEHDGKQYILLKKNRYITKLLTIDDVLKYDVMLKKEKSVLWKKSWEERIDYYEYQINQLGLSYPKIRESFNYYNGLCENAIELLNYVNYEKVNSYLNHHKIVYKEKIDDFFYPTEFIIDSRVRDIGEYIKINYLNSNITINESINIISKINFNRDEIILLMSRLMYPNYYFEEYEKVIAGYVNESKLDFYTEKNVYYETFLKQIYDYFKFKYYIPEIEWLEITLH